jgi:hypothetical protein
MSTDEASANPEIMVETQVIWKLFANTTVITAMESGAAIT